MLFGTSKLLTEYIQRGDSYDKIRKVYSINIVYFSLGHGVDYIYHGKTEFRGIHHGDLLELTPFQKETFHAEAVSDLYPEYYILKVNDFDQVATTPLEEWIHYLNTGDIPSEATAPGLAEGRAEGLEEGAKIKQFEIARNMKQMGLTAEQIALYLGLSIEDIKGL